MALFHRGMRVLLVALMTPFLVAALAGCVPSVSGSDAPGKLPADSKIVIAVQPSASATQLATESKDLEKFLSQRLGREVQVLFPTSSAGVIEALRFGHAHAAFMSAWPLALSQKLAGAEIALAEVREVVIDDKAVEAPMYYSYWVVKPDSQFNSLADLKGRKVALPSQLSTSGYVAPVARLIELGLLPSGDREADPKQFFGDVLYAGGYAQGWEALKRGQVDATVIAGDVPEALYREVLANTRVVERQGPIPSHGVAFAKQLDGDMKKKLTAALLELGKSEHRPIMRKFISSIFVGFRETTAEEHLASLNKYLSLTKLEFTERLR